MAFLILDWAERIMVVETAKVVVDPVALSWETEVKDSEVVVLAMVEVE